MNLITQIATALFTGLAVEAIKKSGPAIAEPVREPEPERELHLIGQQNIMSYDIVGDDDLFGAIGADDDLIDALVSGMGDSEIIGADLLVGASASQNARARKAAMLRKIAARNAAGVVQSGLDKRRRMPLGFVPTAIAAAATGAIPSAPQNLYRPERLIIPSDIAFELGVTDVKVGNQSQFAQNVEVPAAIFSEVAIDSNVHFDTAEVGNQVSVSARNKAAIEVEFTAALIGTVAK